MSYFLNPYYKSLEPYTPGEQPQDKKYVKLNTNESPFPPSPEVLRAVDRSSVEKLRLYSDPTLRPLKEALAERYGVLPEEVFVSNGSDEALNFAFMCFGGDGIAFPDISYGFYQVFAALHHIEPDVKPLQPDFSISVSDYMNIFRAVVIANPNAPTGLTLSPGEIRMIAASNREHVVIVDEAYVDFGAESVIPLTKEFDNLLVIQTFSKSRSLAGARVGYAIGNRELIRDLETIRFSTNPYNVNRLSMAAATAAVKSVSYYKEKCGRIIANRAYTRTELEKRGFTCTDSRANFLFAMSGRIDGRELYLRLKENGILVRHFDADRICQYNRITIGTRGDMDDFLKAVDQIMEAKQ